MIESGMARGLSGSGGEVKSLLHRSQIRRFDPGKELGYARTSSVPVTGAGA
jgi:hypothetical protein